jgi:molecular chaperone DnaJ
MANKDFYEALGVSRSDNEEEIRKGFRKKAMEFHPDRNKSEGAEEKFKEINEAYQVLSDPKKRAQYDRYGRAGVGSNGGQDRPFEGFDVFGGFGDIFDSFFGDVSGRRERQAQRGEDLQQRVVLDFREAVFGTEREVEITRRESCQHCSGAGNEPGTEVSSCTTCRGTGQVRRSQRSIFGQFAQVTPCPACRGSGKVIKTPCTNCRATGIERRKRKIAVTIPAGVEAGMQVRLTGEGDTGRDGGPAGNLYVHLDVREHSQFYREGNDLLYTLSVNVAEAALGVEKKVPNLDGGTETVKVPQGTQPGTEFRIRGKGVPHLHGNRRGDLRVLVNLQVPRSLDAQQRKLLEELAHALNPNLGAEDSNGGQDSNDDGDKGIFEKIKEVLK